MNTSFNFELSVTIIEGRHLSKLNASSCVEISIEKHTKTVIAKTKKTDCPHFNENRRFKFRTTLNDLLQKCLKITLYIPKRMHLGKNVIGVCNIELESVWRQPYHQYYHKWASLYNPDDPFLGVQGFLKCDVSILQEGYEAICSTRNAGSQIEGNLMQPPAFLSKNQKAFFCVNVFRADGVISSNECRNMYISVTFAGSTHQTHVVSNRKDPIWNEALTFSETMPSLFQTIKIELWDAKQKICIGGTTLSLSELSIGKNLGILPTFGPSFIYLHNETKSNTLTYAARLLLEFTTEILSQSNRNKLIIKKRIAPYDESNFPRYEQFTLVFAVMHYSFFNSKMFGKEMNVRIVHGSFFNQADKMGDNNSSDAKVNLENNVLSFPSNSAANGSIGKLQCAQLTTPWPSQHDKELKQNRLKHLFRKILNRLTHCRDNHLLGISERCSVSNLLKEVISCCDNILIQPGLKFSTNLDVALRTSLHEDIHNLKQTAMILLKNRDAPGNWLQDMMENIEHILRYSESKNPTFPDIELTVSVSNKEFHKCLKSSNYLFAERGVERGEYCGKVHTLWLQDASNCDACAMDVFIWLGKTEDYSKCLKFLPKENLTRESLIGVKEITPSEVHKFDLRVHIYQGRFNPDTQVSGLIDPFVRVYAFDEIRETQVKSQTLDPIWDETLVIPNIFINADNDFIARSSTGVIFEVFQFDNGNAVKTLGRGVVRPVVKLLQSTYLSPRMRWETFQNCGHSVGAILVAMELIEISGEATSPIEYSPTTIFRIPDSIKPHYAGYNLDVVFWGLRNIKEVGPLTRKPDVVAIIECNQSRVKSSTVKFTSNCNFDSTVQTVEVMIPTELEYVPPLILTLHEVSLSNRLTFKGSCFVPTVMMFRDGPTLNAEPTTKRESVIKDLKKFVTFQQSEDFDEHEDWWSVYYDSKRQPINKQKIVIYDTELEKWPEFCEFKDPLKHFSIKKPRSCVSGSSDVRDIIALMKCCIRLYPIQDPAIDPSTIPPFHHPTNKSVDIVVRVYIICAHNLPATDINGRCDPYIAISFGKTKISDRKNYINKDVNPIFGKYFELRGSLPNDNTVTIRVMDHDIGKSDDLVGSTTIDIEDRYYSRHRASCGIADTYRNEGAYKWRDISSPSEILNEMCIRTQMPKPIFSEQCLRIGEFTMPRGQRNDDEVALEVLHNFRAVSERGISIVPQHIETRSLFNPATPYIEQGKLEMWVDIFPDLPDLPPPVDVATRQPLEMELRVIVWRATEVLFSDYNYVTGVKSSDIFVKAWLTDESQHQKTDVHENSTTGEGIFNWRFIFPFNYSTIERKAVVQKKVDFSHALWPEKLPCILEVQVWDEDAIKDDFIGSLSLNLCSMPEGSKFAKLCTLKTSGKKCDLFKKNSIRGWWPLRSMHKSKDGEFTLAGKIDMEIEILSKDEAENNPVGLGRNGPQALPEPMRPKQTAFWKTNPLTYARSVVAKRIGKQLIIFGIFGVVGLLAFVILSSLPTILLEKLIDDD